MGGICFNKEKEPDAKELPKSKVQPQVESVDIVKMKLKQARDRIRTFISKKNTDIAQLDAQIQAKLPAYEATKNKKELIPLLKAKKDLLNAVEQGDVRLKLVNEKLSEVEMSQLNKETIDVLDDSNKYIREVQEELENKDWRGILAEAQNKYELEWPDDREEVEEDPEFQKMWDQLGGNKLSKPLQKKKVAVQISSQENRQLALS